MEYLTSSDEWVTFYPLGVMDDPVPPPETLDQLHTVYGKYVIGMVGYNVAWGHAIANTNRLRLTKVDEKQ